jgi:hypothetical protein
MDRATLRRLARQHTAAGTRSSYRLCAALQAPLRDRLRLLLTHASGIFTVATLEDALAQIEGTAA